MQPRSASAVHTTFARTKVLCGEGAYARKGAGGLDQHVIIQRVVCVVESATNNQEHDARRGPVPEDLGGYPVSVRAHRAACFRRQGVLPQAPTTLPCMCELGSAPGPYPRQLRLCMHEALQA